MAFLFQGLLPKTSTQAKLFCEENPEYDGRGVVIAILDTGVDPGALGLQQTSTGLPKLLDIQDCTGAGDVDMRTKRVIQFDMDGNTHFVMGKSGRRISIDPKWFRSAVAEEEKEDPQIEGREVRVGFKPAYDLFPCDLVDRIKEERKREFAKAQNEAEAAASRSLAAGAAGAGATSSSKEKMNEDEPAIRLAELKKQATDEYLDVGPMLDVVSFQDEEGLWRVVVNGNAPLPEYRVGQSFAKLDDATQLNYGVNVFERGDVVSIVVDSGSHGTHVAGIASACFGEGDERNGVAPGAQLVSLKIGDIRLGGGMETTNAICRALAHCASNGVDVINMSFGESFASSAWMFADHCRVLRLMRELVEKHQVTFVASAGNAGPSLSTVSAPGGLLPSLIGVGAFVDSDMKSELYSLLPHDDVEAALNYTWSSRGPALDGSLGVSVSAPGGAITSVPQWTLHGKQLMNGTSMAAPNCAGCVALIISGLKQLGLKSNPVRIKRALETTALVLRGVEPFAQGHGLVQVKDAFALASAREHQALHFDLPIDVKVFKLGHARTLAGHGIYLRDDLSCTDFDVQIHAQFPLAPGERIGFAQTHTTRMDEVNLELAVDLECNAAWVKLPSSQVYLNSQPTVFKLSLETKPLAQGFHFAEVWGFDAQNRAAGPLFRVPITVIIPHYTRANGDASCGTEMSFPLGEFARKFFKVPLGATWCNITLQSLAEDTSTLVAMHCLETRNHVRFREDESTFTGRLPAHGVPIKRTVRVSGENGGVLEVCIAKYWSQHPEINSLVKLAVDFFGYTAPSSVDLSASNSFVAPVPVSAALRAVHGGLEPAQMELTRQHVSIPSKSSEIRALFPESRNAVLGAFPPDSRILWELKLEYEFTLPGNAADKTCKIKPPRLGFKLNEYLYEHFIESQFIQVFDRTTKRLIMYSDYVGGTDKEMEVPASSSSALLAVAHIRHEDRSVLERLEHVPLIVNMQLAAPIKLACYSQPIISTAHAFVAPQQLALGREVTLFTTLADGVLKTLKPGCYSGQFKLAKDCPVTHGITLNFAPHTAVAAEPQSGKNNGSKPTAEKTLEERWVVPLVEARLGLLKKLGSEEEDGQVFKAEMDATLAMIAQLKAPQAVKEWTTKALLVSLAHAQAELERALDSLDLNQEQGEAEFEREQLPRELVKLLEICQAVYTVDEANEQALLGEIHAVLDYQAVCGGDGGRNKSAFDALVASLEKKAGKTALCLQYVKLRVAMRDAKYGTALQLASKLLTEATPKDLEALGARQITVQALMQRKLDLFAMLGWTHVVEMYHNRILVQHPEDLARFA